MAVQWIGLVLSMLFIRTDAAPLKGESPVSSNSNCSSEDFIQTGGVCDSIEHRQIQDICREIRKEQGLIYNRLETGYEAADGVTCFGDLLLDKSQALEFLQALRDRRLGSTKGGRVKRKIRSDFHTNKWPTHIYYRVDGSISGGAAVAVREGVSMWQDVTCLQFTEITDENSQDHLLFLDGGTFLSGCRSYIGRVTGLTAQPIYLSYSCGYKAVVAHEIAHALGLIHEHQRPDRDSYVTVNTANIRRGYEGYFAAFKPNVVTSLGVDYDYASVMHYYGTAFSTQAYTIQTKDPRYQTTIGQRVEISHLDAKLINKAYCADTCDNTPQLSCDHHGYQDPNDCSRCRCPDGWEGRLCETLATGKNAECGGTLTATTEPQYIESPGYNSKKLYDLGQECTWLIKTSPPSGVVIRFATGFGVLSASHQCRHWVEVKFDPNGTGPGARYCGSSRPSDIITSSGSEVMVLFRARFMMKVRSEMRGFRLKYTSDENACSNEPCENEGVCHSHENGFECECKHGFHGRTCQHYNFDIDKDIDLVLMIDQTYHSYKDFYYFKTLAQRLLSYINNDDISIHHGIMSFYSSAHVQAELDSYPELFALRDIVDSLYTEYGGTDIFSAFNLLFDKYYMATPADRLSVSNVAVMIADSRHTYWTSQGMILEVQRKLREMCVEVVVVDIGSRVDRGLLETLVGRDSVLHQQQHQDLLKPGVIDSVITKVKAAIESSEDCIKSKTTTKRTTVLETTPTTTTSTTTTTTTSSTTSTTTSAPTTTTDSTSTATSSSSSSTSTTSSTSISSTVSSTTTTQTTSEASEASSSTTTSSSTSSTSTTSVPTSASSSTTSASTTSTSTQSTTSTTTSQTTPTTDTPSSGCITFKESCDHKCGGCGYMDVTQYCFVDGVKQITDRYREPCNRSPCEKDCSVWIGRFYKRTCKMCCPGYIVRGKVCIQDDE